MKIKKFIVVVSLVAVLIGLSLPNSFAVDPVSINSPLTEPVPFVNQENGKLHCKDFYVVKWSDSYSIDHQYMLYEIEYYVPLNTQLCCSNRSAQHVFIWSSSVPDQPYALRTYDILTGNIISDTSINGWEHWNSPSFSWADGAIRFRSDGYFPKASAYSTNFDYGYYITDHDIQSGGSSSSTNVSPFVIWSTAPPLQTIYKSPLSEPVADEYNSYVVLDDKLIWISYRVNSMYTRSSSIENSSEIYSSLAQIEESGTGSYAGQQNGYTEEIVLPSLNYSGSSTGSTEDITLSDNQNGYGGNYSGSDPDHSSPSFYTGAWYFANQNLGSINFSGNHSGIIQGASFGNIDFSGVNSGSVHFNNSGTVTLKDKEYYPISFSQTDIQKFYRLYLLPVSSDNFVFWLAPDRSFSSMLNDEIVINMDFFYSEFDLNGNYIRSTFHTVTETDIGLFDAYQPEEDVSSVRCYGIDFYNINNIPLNLSSVLWQYDFEFSAWRDSMLNMLTAIYNALTSDSNVPEAPTTANWGQEVHDMEPTSTISNNEVISIYDNVGEINSSLSDSSYSLHSLVDMFSVGKLIGLVAFALSIGTAILILGKKKSE